MFIRGDVGIALPWPHKYLPRTDSESPRASFSPLEGQVALSSPGPGGGARPGLQVVLMLPHGRLLLAVAPLYCRSGMLTSFPLAELLRKEGKTLLPRVLPKH